MRSSLIALAAAGAVSFAAPAAAQSLEQTIAAALDRSPALAAADARMDAARASLDQAKAERAPSASLQGQVGAGRIDPRGFFGLPADNVTPRVARVEAQLPLFTGGKIGAAVAQARGGLDVAGLERSAVALDLRLQVISAYTNALAAQERVRAYEAMSSSMTEVLRQSRLLFKTGAATSTDVSESEARLAQAEAGLAAARGNLAAAREQLTLLAGSPVALDPVLPPPLPIPPSAEASIAAALESNPRIEQARRAVDIAEAGTRSARSDYLPTIAAYAEASSIRDQFFPGYKADAASVGVRAKWNFFSGGRTGAKVSKAEAEARAAKFDVMALEDQLRVQTVQRYEATTAAAAMLIAAEKRAAATQAALRSTRLEVKAGAKPQSALLDAEREAIDAESARIEAAGQQLSAAYALRALAGLDSGLDSGMRTGM